MITKDDLYEAMDLAEELGASAVKLHLSHAESTAVSFESGRLKNIGGEESMAYGISVIVDGRRGSAVGNQRDILPDLTRRAVKLAQIGAEAHFATFPKPAAAYRELQSFDPAVATLTRQRLVEDCQDVVDFLKSQDGALVVDAEGGTEFKSDIVVNNAGLHDEYQTSSWILGAGIQKLTGTDMLMAGKTRAFGKLNELYDKEAIKGSIMEDVHNAARTARLPDGTCPLIIPPSFVKRFLAPVLGALSGKSVYLGTSPLKDKLHQSPFSANLSILDDPFREFSGDEANMDDCGIPTSRRLLIDHGRIPQFLYDYDTACLAKAAPTGNSGCAPNSAMLVPGDTASAELFASVGRGLFIKRLLGFGQSNFANGDFSANVELGYAIEKGVVTGRVKDTMIAGNVFEMLSGGIEVSSDVDANNGQPYLLCPAVSIYSK